MANWQQLATSRQSFLVAPAGYGKTRLIAEAVANSESRSELILTHTHAGVDALRKKLREMNADSSKFRVDTIAGWALRYAASFPSISGLQSAKPVKTQWTGVYGAATNLLSNGAIKEILKASYSGVYVDEYQDCTIDQHTLVVALSRVLPCRVLGDPLQAIFDFKNNTLVNWHSDVGSHFTALPELSYPWRWHKASAPLGKWLADVRTNFLSRKPVDLRGAPSEFVKWISLPADNSGQFITQLRACRECNKASETTVAIHHWESQCNRLVNSLAPMFWNIETIECEDLIKSAKVIESAKGMGRVDAVIDFLAACFTGVQQELKTIVAALRGGQKANRKEYKRQAELELLRRVSREESLSPVLLTLEQIKSITTLKLWRRELYHSMCQSLREHATGAHDSLADAAWAVRNRVRHVGRPQSRRLVGRTLLVKGLEFDHAIVLDAEALKMKDLYVALTRGTRSLTVLSRTPILNPDL